MILYGGLGMNKLQFLRRKKKFSAFFPLPFLVIKTLDPDPNALGMLDPDPDPGANVLRN
jgi:hypothetical protein